MSCDLAGTDATVLMIDREHLAERCVGVALAITTDGIKLPVGLWEGATENKTVDTALLTDLVARDLAFDDGLLLVLDGKALAAGVREVFGAKAIVQRCTLHKRRNVADHRGRFLAGLRRRTFVTDRVSSQSGLSKPQEPRFSKQARHPVLFTRRSRHVHLRIRVRDGRSRCKDGDRLISQVVGLEAPILDPVASLSGTARADTPLA